MKRRRSLLMTKDPDNEESLYYNLPQRLKVMGKHKTHSYVKAPARKKAAAKKAPAKKKAAAKKAPARKKAVAKKAPARKKAVGE